MTDVGGVCRFRAETPFDHQPDAPVRQVLLTERHPLARKRLRDGPLGAFRDGALIPARRRQTGRQRRHGAGGGSGGAHHTLGAHGSFRSGGLVLRLGALAPATRLRRHGDERRDADARVHGIEKVGAMALEAIRYHRLERQERFLHERL
jgi:hypothetical protein